MGTEQFSLRELQASDSEALKKLITEFDDDLTTRFQVDPYQAIVSGTEFRTTGVVVEHPDFDGFVGMGTVRFGKIQFNGDVLPLAFLDGLKVNKEFRGRGLGYQIANWRVQRAREEFGNNGVIATGMLYDNYASYAVASKWCREFLESAFDVLIIPVRTKAPTSITGIEVREIEPDDHEEFARKQDHYYGHYNFYSSSTPDSLAQALDISVEGRKPYRYYVAVDSRGNILAGAQTWARGVLKSDTVNEIPVPLRVMNRFLHLLPPDFTIRDIVVNALWFEAGQFKAACYLWEMIRWLSRDQGTMLAAGFDSRDDTIRVVNAKPWHQPRPKITYALHGPAEIERKRLVHMLGRV